MAIPYQRRTISVLKQLFAGAPGRGTDLLLYAVHTFAGGPSEEQYQASGLCYGSNKPTQFLDRRQCPLEQLWQCDVPAPGPALTTLKV